MQRDYQPQQVGTRWERRWQAMLWLILGIILLAIAIAGGAIIHPIIFVLGILALFMAVSGWRGRTV
jgi:Flp pilus assembly protein TadB